MVKIRKNGSSKITIVSNQIVRDDSLSWKARGIFVYLWSQSENWNFYEKEVAKHSADGLASLRSGIKELENHGYINRTRERVNGKLATPVWILSEEPKCEKPILENQTFEFQTFENRTLSNTNRKKHQLEETPTKRDIGSASAESDLCKDVIDYLNEKLGTKYKPNSAINKRLIDARAKEGYSLDDFKTVIDNKCATWSNDQKMSKYLRPQTLFGTKFESYLNEKAPSIPQHTDFKKAMLTDDTVENIPDDELPF